MGGAALVARRDVLSLLRAWWAFALLAVLVALLGVGAYRFLPEGAATSSEVSGYARVLYGGYRTYLTAIAYLVLPGLAALLVTVERQSNTLDQLRVSSLSSGQIVLGKTVAALVLYTLLCAATFPIAGVVYFFAGVDLWSLALLPFSLGPVAILCVSVGLNMGLQRRDVFSAWMGAIASLVMLNILLRVAGVFVFVLFLVPPIQPFIVVLSPVLRGVLALGISAVILLLCRRLLRVVERQAGENLSRRPSSRSVFGFQPLVSPESAERRSLRDDKNVVYQKEQWTSRLCAGAYSGRMLIAGLVWGALSAVLMQPIVDTTLNVMHLGFFELLLPLAIVPGIAVVLLAQEQHSGALMHLRLSILPAQEVLWGKVQAILGAFILFFGGTFFLQVLAGGEPLMERSTVSPLKVFFILLVQSALRLPLYTILAACLALPGALLGRTMLSAQLLGYGGAVAGIALFEALGVLVREWLPGPRGPGTGPTLVDVTLADFIFLAAIAGGAFALACRLYGRPRADWD